MNIPMNGDRFVVLGVAPARAPWFRTVSQWANAASLPLEFLKCLSPEEVRARLASGQPFSALLADAGVPAVDRDLLSAAARADCAVVVIEDKRVRRDWVALGAAVTLPPDFDRDQLLGVLQQHAVHVTQPDHQAIAEAPPATTDHCVVVAVTGPGGTGASTAAIALAQGAAAESRGHRRVLLADFCLHAEQAMLHDVRDVAPGLQELVDAHRFGNLAAAETRALAFRIAERRYDLLLGLRHARFWSALRPKSIGAAFESLMAAYGTLVCDVDGDLEGESESGSLDVEERNGLSRLAVQRADVVIAVGAASMKGLHSLAVTVGGIHAAAPGAAVLAVVNCAPRSPRGRAEITSALHQLVRGASPDRQVFGPVFLPERKVDSLLRDGARLPAPLVQTLTGAVGALLAEGARRERSVPLPSAVRPGSLGTWTEPATG
jgi:hypothetical protein